jgi:hypothetical protein
MVEPLWGRLSLLEFGAMSKRLLGLAAALALLAGPASATIVFGTGNPGGGLDTLTLPQAGDDDGSDALLVGTVNPADTQVSITGDENIDSASSGQSRVVASDGSTLDFLNFALQGGFGATTFVFNLNNVGSIGAVILQAADQFGHTYTSSPFSLGSGENFFNVTTLDDQLITKVSFLSTPLADVRQIRLGDVQLISAIPEPASWSLLIAGLAGVGALLRRRRGAVFA